MHRRSTTRGMLRRTHDHRHQCNATHRIDMHRPSSTSSTSMQCNATHRHASTIIDIIAINATIIIATHRSSSQCMRTHVSVHRWMERSDMTSRSDAIRVDPGSRATEGSSTYTIPPKSAGGAGSAGLGRKWPSSPPRTVPDRGLGGPLKRGCQTLRTGRSGRRSKKCTFCWVFNNSPSRDKIRHFFRTAISTNPHFWGISNVLGTKTGPKKGGSGRSKIRPPARAEIFRIFAARPPAEKRPFFDPFSGVEKRPKSTLFGGSKRGQKPPFLGVLGLPQGIPSKPQKRPFRALSGDPPYRRGS